MKKLAIMAFAIFALTGYGSIESKASESIKFKIHGYFKHNRHRIKTVEMIVKAIDDTTREKALNYGRKSMNTTGRLTAVYFYASGRSIPNDQLTLANNVFSANDILYEGKNYSAWVYAYMKGINGKEIFVDCMAKPEDFLCRQ